METSAVTVASENTCPLISCFTGVDAASKMWYLGDDRSHFWFYIKAACRRRDLRSCITNIDNIENIKSPVAKVRKLLTDRVERIWAFRSTYIIVSINNQ